MSENEYLRVCVCQSYMANFSHIYVGRYRDNHNGTHTRLRIKHYPKPSEALVNHVLRMIREGALRKSEIQGKYKLDVSFVTSGGI